MYACVNGGTKGGRVKTKLKPTRRIIAVSAAAGCIMCKGFIYIDVIGHRQVTTS